MTDVAHMRAALALARRGLGRTWPNPAVGCVLVGENGAVVGRGWTQPGGRPHAETEALRRAGPASRGATAYVTLEPCAHWGRTPPCAEALIDAGVKRVVLALEDPDPRVSGEGAAKLRAVGIAVESGFCAGAAYEINAGFFSRIRRGRPLVTLKLASTLDGRIATAAGESRWITGDAARARGHLLRATHDGVMVGSGTVLADDPELTCRLPGLGDRRPLRLVVDGHERVPLGARLVREAQQGPSWFIVRPDGDPARRAALAGQGVTLVDAPPGAAGGIDLPGALAALGSRGVTRVLVEGGAALAAALLAAGLVDRIAWFRAPCLIGGDGLAAVAPLGIGALADAPRFERLALETVGEDVLETLQPAP